MNVFALIRPLGILTYTFLLITVIAGLRRWNLKYHRLLAFITLALATLHAALVIYATI